MGSVRGKERVKMTGKERRAGEGKMPRGKRKEGGEGQAEGKEI